MNQKGNILVGVLIGLFIAAGLAGAYYLGAKQSDQRVALPQPSPEIKVSKPESDIPSSWIVKKSDICNASFQLPPNQAPYITPNNLNEGHDAGAFWQFEEDDKYSNDIFTKSLHIFYRNPEALGSGYLAGSVRISCSNNTGYTTDTLLATYEKNITDGTYQGFAIKSKVSINKWGRQVWEVRHSGGMYDDTYATYYFATPSHIYSVFKISMSQNQSVKEATEKIFDSLQF